MLRCGSRTAADARDRQRVVPGATRQRLMLGYQKSPLSGGT